MHYKLDQIKQEIELLQSVVKNQNYADYSFQDLCNFHIKDSARKKAKGFHLAFNVKEKLDDNALSKYEYS